MEPAPAIRLLSTRRSHGRTIPAPSSLAGNPIDLRRRNETVISIDLIGIPGEEARPVSISEALPPKRSP